MDNDYENSLLRIYAVANSTMRKKLMQWSPTLCELLKQTEQN